MDGSWLRARATQLREASQAARDAPGTDSQPGHTVSQRLRKLKQIPAELIPLGIVIAAALIAAVYSMGRKLAVDKTLRLNRTGKQQ